MTINWLPICALTFGLITSTYASEKTMNIHNETITKATYIQLISKQNSQSNLEQFLKKGAELVKQTEPDTALWFGLKNDKHLSIFDVFFNEQGREKHFAGAVAQALKDNADAMVLGGWEQGVLNQVHHYDIIAASHYNKVKVLQAREASYIVFKAKPGKSQALEQLLQAGAELINTTEPETYFWLALKTDKDTYAIFDAFSDKNAQNTHFSGQVAAALEKNAEDLIEGGWQQGVLAHVENFSVIAAV